MILFILGTIFSPIQLPERNGKELLVQIDSGGGRIAMFDEAKEEIKKWKKDGVHVVCKINFAGSEAFLFLQLCDEKIATKDSLFMWHRRQFFRLTVLGPRLITNLSPELKKARDILWQEEETILKEVLKGCDMKQVWDSYDKESINSVSKMQEMCGKNWVRIEEHL